jgi:glycosyltransferase involved in cell wall biosynthesis
MSRTSSQSERFDVVCYAPWASSLVARASAEVPAAGTETQLLKLASGLAERGLRVGMIVIGDSRSLPRTADGVRILAQPARRGSSGASARASLAVGALRSMMRGRTDVLIQSNAGPTTAVAALVARLRGARFVYLSASVVDFEFEAHEARSLNVRLYEWGIRHAWKVVVQNDEQERLCRARFGREPVVIKSIADPPGQEASRPEAFLWVGRLQELKRPEAYLALARALPEARFRMIAVPQPGEAPDARSAVEAAARDLPNFELLEPRSREGVVGLMDTTVAVVNTSIREGLPNVFMEGWSHGVPALALSFDPDGLIVRHRLGAFAEGDEARLLVEAQRLWDGRTDRADLAERCIEYVRTEHDRDAVVDRWIDAIVHGD